MRVRRNRNCEEKSASCLQTRILSKEELDTHKEEVIEKVKSVLYVTRDVAVRVLRHFSWNPNKANEDWFALQVGARWRAESITNV